MSISFSALAKAEICRNFPTKHCCAVAECFGILLFCNSFGGDGIRIITESRELGQALPKLFRKAFDLGFDAVPEDTATGKLVFQITDPVKIDAVMSAYGFSSRDTLSSMSIFRCWRRTAVRRHFCGALFWQVAL